MIYKIENKDITDAMVNGASVICWQSDGKYVLVSSDVQIEQIESYSNEEKNSLMNLPIWRQPCVGCEI